MFRGPYAIQSKLLRPSLRPAAVLALALTLLLSCAKPSDHEQTPSSGPSSPAPEPDTQLIFTRPPPPKKPSQEPKSYEFVDATIGSELTNRRSDPTAGRITAKITVRSPEGRLSTIRLEGIIVPFDSSHPTGNGKAVLREVGTSQSRVVAAAYCRVTSSQQQCEEVILNAAMKDHSQKIRKQFITKTLAKAAGTSVNEPYEEETVEEREQADVYPNPIDDDSATETSDQDHDSDDIPHDDDDPVVRGEANLGEFMGIGLPPDLDEILIDVTETPKPVAPAAVDAVPAEAATRGDTSTATNAAVPVAPDSAIPVAAPDKSARDELPIPQSAPSDEVSADKGAFIPSLPPSSQAQTVPHSSSPTAVTESAPAPEPVTLPLPPSSSTFRTAKQIKAIEEAEGGHEVEDSSAQELDSSQKSKVQNRIHRLPPPAAPIRPETIPHSPDRRLNNPENNASDDGGSQDRAKGGTNSGDKSGISTNAKPEASKSNGESPPGSAKQPVTRPPLVTQPKMSEAPEERITTEAESAPPVHSELTPDSEVSGTHQYPILMDIIGGGKAVGPPGKNGRLVNGSELSSNGTGHSRQIPRKGYPAMYWGTGLLISFVQNASAYLVSNLFPDLTIYVNDIARKTGGIAKKSNGKVVHISHRSGLDVDIKYLGAQPGDKLAQIGPRGHLFDHFKQFDFTPTWEFLRLAAQQKVLTRDGKEVTSLNYIFVAPAIKRALCDFTERENRRDELDLTILRRLYTTCSGHHDHFHIRFKCTQSYPECLEQADPKPRSQDGCGEADIRPKYRCR